ncbi:MAG: DUF1722 domain-containing protein, partial [Clostridiaceae bacterium]|nr:DUF1722 domain-containing protein [Clostridiaceae bacterium]
KFIDKTLMLTLSEKNFLNTAYHVWGYFKDVATIKERERFDMYINNKDFNEKFKLFIYKLALKYNTVYLLESYYFLY